MGDIRRYRADDDFLSVDVPDDVKWKLINARRSELEIQIQRLREDIKEWREIKIPQLEAKVVMLELKKAKLDNIIKQGDVQVLPDPNL